MAAVGDSTSNLADKGAAPAQAQAAAQESQDPRRNFNYPLVKVGEP